MARIRTVKPEYFRHELLQDLEISHPELHPMLVFAGLWGQCDKNGVFEYKPRQLKLDILPFLEYDMVASLTLLKKCGLVSLLVFEEKVYGYVPSFKKHQRINGQEAKSNSKFPQPEVMTEYHPPVINKEAPEKQQGSNKEEGEGKGTDIGKGKGKEQLPTVGDVVSLYRTYAGVNTENTGQVVVIQDFIKRFSLPAIEEAFQAAACANIETRSFLNWCKKRLERSPPAGATIDPQAKVIKERDEQMAHYRSIGLID